LLKTFIPIARRTPTSIRFADHQRAIAAPSHPQNANYLLVCGTLTYLPTPIFEKESPKIVLQAESPRIKALLNTRIELIISYYFIIQSKGEKYIFVRNFHQRIGPNEDFF
jgi:hypothetical protein